jgi:hypothetical protein
MEQRRGQIRDGEQVLYDGLVYLASYDVAGVVSWCGLVLAPLGAFPPERPVLMIHLADGRTARIAIARGTTGTGRLATVHFDIVGAWSQSTG